MAVTAIGIPLGVLVLKVLVEFSVQNPFRKRLLQVVEQSVLGKHLIRIAAGKQLVQKFLLDSHVMILSFPSSWASRTEFLTVPQPPIRTIRT